MKRRRVKPLTADLDREILRLDGQIARWEERTKKGPRVFLGRLRTRREVLIQMREARLKRAAEVAERESAAGKAAAIADAWSGASDALVGVVGDLGDDDRLMVSAVLGTLLTWFEAEVEGAGGDEDEDGTVVEFPVVELPKVKAEIPPLDLD